MGVASPWVVRLAVAGRVDPQTPRSNPKRQLSTFGYTSSTIVALAMPPPSHIVCRP